MEDRHGNRDNVVGLFVSTVAIILPNQENPQLENLVDSKYDWSVRCFQVQINCICENRKIRLSRSKKVRYPDDKVGFVGFDYVTSRSNGG